MDSLKTVVLIEDDPLDSDFFSSLIQGEYPNINIITYNSFEADMSLDLKPEETIVLLDLSIRGKDGLSFFTQYLKPNHFPTFVLSSSDNPQDITRSKDLGVLGFFQKEIGADKILEQFKAIINFIRFNHIKDFNTETINEKYIQEIKMNELLIDELRFEVSKLRNNQLYPKDFLSSNLKESDELFIKIAKSFSAGIYIYDIQKQTNLYMNKEYERITGFGIKEVNALSGENFLELFHPDDVDHVLSHMGEVSSAENDGIYKLEYRFKHKNGDWIKLMSLDRVFERDENGNVRSFIGSFFEI